MRNAESLAMELGKMYLAVVVVAAVVERDGKGDTIPILVE